MAVRIETVLILAFNDIGIPLHVIDVIATALSGLLDIPTTIMPFEPGTVTEADRLVPLPTLVGAPLSYVMADAANKPACRNIQKKNKFRHKFTNLKNL